MMLTDVATGYSAVTLVLGQKLGSPTCFNEFLTVLTGQGDDSPGNPEQTRLVWALGITPTHHASLWS